jgi:hypothetical protein
MDEVAVCRVRARFCVRQDEETHLNQDRGLGLHRSRAREVFVCGRMKRPGIREQSLVGALGDESIESGVLGEDVGFFCEDIAQGVFILWQQNV